MPDRRIDIKIEELRPGDGAAAAPVRLPAGDFSDWLRGTESSLRSGKGRADVPCGACTACCRSSMFIHIRPEETRTIQRIPHALLFPAPGLPKGHVLMGYNDKGHCPMLIDNKCSIYAYRPQTCRDYDCRVFAATGVPLDLQTQPEIAERVKVWAFDYQTEEGRQEHTILQQTAAFLQENRNLFPEGTLPANAGQLPAIAIGAYRLFADMTAKMHHGQSASPEAVVQAIVTA